MNILLVDKRVLFRDALAHYVRSVRADSNIVSLQSISQVTKKPSTERPDMILLHLDRSDLGRFLSLEHLCALYHGVPVIILADDGDPQEQKKCFAAGAKGYVPFHLSLDSFVTALECVGTGRTFMPPASTHEPATGGRLTRRETEVLELLCSGLPNKEIAERLNLQLVTVKLHVRGICRKLDAGNRTQAALRGQTLGFSRLH